MSKLPESINVDMAFSPELRQAQAELDVYQASRPSMDANGRFHNPDNGAFISKDTANSYYSSDLENLQDTDEYADMSLRELCEISVDSEINEDITTMSSVDDYILDKIDGMDLKDVYVGRDGSSRDKSELDNVFDRVMKLREDIKRKKLHENPSKVSELKDEQINTLADSWERQAGKKIVWSDKKDAADNDDSDIEMLALPPAPTPEISDNNEEEIPSIEINDDDESDLPSIEVDDENSTASDSKPEDDNNSSSDVLEPALVKAGKERRVSRKAKKIIALGTFGLLAVGAVLAGLNRLNDGDSNESNDGPVATEEVELLEPSDDVLAQLEAIDAEAENSDSSETTEITANEEDIAELEQAIQERTVEIANTQGEFGNTTWDKATVLYGDQATPRLIQAAEAVAADGIEVEWTADPNTSTEADLFINGSNDPSVVWQFLATRLAKQDFTNLFENIESSETGDQVLPETE